MLQEIFEVTESRRYWDKYHGYTEPYSHDKFRVIRQWPWQKWRLMTACGIGMEPGMEFDSYKIQAGSYQVRNTYHLIDIHCKRVTKQDIEQFPYFSWSSGSALDLVYQNVLSGEDWREILVPILQQHSAEEIETARCSITDSTAFGLDSSLFSGDITLKEHLHSKGLNIFSAAGLPS